MTNIQKWNAFMSGIPSPQSYIDFGFYYLIAASLQRRVWIGPDHQQLFPNVYIILVGEPGVGKGLVINQVSQILKYHKLEQTVNGHAVKSDAMDDAVNEANYNNATKRKSIDKPLLIPVAADATTFEALTNAMARSTRGISYRAWEESLQKHVSKAYLHCSLCFCLEEISSLFRKKGENVVHFLIKTYDCGDYEYDTKTQGTDVIKRSCLNLFGGTTPSFVESTFDDRLLNDGYSSRNWFIFEAANRFNVLSIPDLTPEQQQHRKDIIDHVKKLTYLYGQVKFAPDAWEFLNNWWKNDAKRANTSPKLAPYYARKNIHAQKMAMAMHFGEDAEMDENKAPKNAITLECCKMALARLEEIEMKMHLALSFEGNNPLAVVSKKLIKFIRVAGPQTTKELQAQFWDDVTTQQLNEIIEFLVKTNKLSLDETATGTKLWKLI